MNKCKNCRKETNNPKFCSRSCAATYNNKRFPKRQWHCGKCNLQRKRPTPHATVCSSCRLVKPILEDHTLEEIRSRKKLSSNIHDVIRFRARKWALTNLDMICQKCGYSKYVEVAHIKPISSFPDDAKISMVNHKDNILVLCPNCHWELDHPKK